MKKFLFLLTGGLLSGLSSSKLHAQRERATDEAMLYKNKVALSVQDATADDYMIELGRATDLNIIADVTDSPVDTDPINLSATKTLYGLVGDLVGPSDMRALPFDQTTLMFWPAPHLLEIAELIRAERKTTLKPAFEALSDETAPKKWEEYLRQTHKWDGKWDGVDIRVAVDDLPADLRSQVHQEIKRRLGEGKSAFIHQGRDRHEFWAGSRLYIGQGRRDFTYGTQPEPYMILSDSRILPGGGSADVPIGPMQRQAR